MGDFILYGIHPEPIPPCKTCQNSTRAAFETAVRKLFTSFAQASVRTSFAQSQNYLAHEPIEHQVQTCFTLKTNQHQISAKPVCASSRKLAPGMVTIAEAEVGMLPFFAVKIIPGSAILSQVQALSFPKIFLNGDLQDMVRYGCIF